MENNDFIQEFQKNIEKLTLEEKYRKEQHGSSRIIFNQEISPVQMYQNVMDKTVFIYKNRVPEEGSKVITGLRGIKRNRRIGIIIQIIGLLLILLFVLFFFRFDSIQWDHNIKLVCVGAMLFGIPILLFMGAVIRSSGRKYMADYLDVWNSLADQYKGPMEVHCLENGQLVLMKYIRRNKECGEYVSALNPDDTEYHPYEHKLYQRVKIPTYVVYMYVIDSIKSCTKTENGLMIESSGRYYGLRAAKCLTSGNNMTWIHVFAETQISYRKEEIPAILENMDQLEAALMNYGYYEPGRDTFSPLTSMPVSR